MGPQRVGHIECLTLLLFKWFLIPIVVKFPSLDLRFFSFVHIKQYFNSCISIYFIPRDFHTQLTTTRDHFRIKDFDYCPTSLAYYGNCTQQVSNDSTVPPGFYPSGNETREPDFMMASATIISSLQRTATTRLLENVGLPTPVYSLIPW